MTKPTLLLLPLLAAVACTRPNSAEKTAPPPRPHYLAGVPLIPQSIINDTTGTPEVEHQGLVLQAPFDSVVRFYRRELPARGWTVMSDVADTQLASLYLQRDTIALWLQIHSIGPLATEYALTATGAGGVAARAAPPR